MIYKIGNLLVDSGTASMEEAVAALPGFRNFESSTLNHEEILIRLSFIGNSIGDTISHDNKITSELIYHITADDAEIFLCRHNNNSFTLLTECEGKSLAMKCHPDRPEVLFSGSLCGRLLNYALWVAYGIRALRRGRVLVHSSAVECDGAAYLFLGESGTGKSTHTQLWTQNIPGARLLNDDSPIVAFENGRIVAYGSPWSGKTSCYKQECHPLGAMTRLSQAPTNEIRKLRVAEAYAALHPSMPPAFNFDAALAKGIERMENAIISNIPIFAMRCLPNPEAAILSHSMLRKTKS